MPFDTRQPLSIQAARTINVGRGSGGGGGGLPAPAGTWQYPANEDWYATGSREMYLVGPHPDPVTDPTSEVDPNAGHLWASPDFAYEQDLFVIFGSPPWHFELLEGPTGMVIGEFMQVENGLLKYHKDYGKVIWPNPTNVGQPADGWLVRVRVRDQDFNRGHSELIAEWRLKVDANKFLVIANGGDNANPGTWAQPKADFDGWYLGDETSTQFEGMHVVFRGGSYVPRGDFENANGNIAMWRNGGRHPKTFIVPRGETVNFDCSEANWLWWSNPDDIAFKGHFVFNGSKTQNPDGSSIANCRNMTMVPAGNNRFYMSEVEIKDLVPGSAGTDNPAFLWRSSGGGVRGANFGFKSCAFDGATASSNGPGTFLVSSTNYIANIGHSLKNWKSFGGFGEKSSCKYNCMYFIDAWDAENNCGNTIGSLNTHSYDAIGTGGGDYLYNKSWNGLESIGAGWGTTANETHETMTFKRNTGKGRPKIGGNIDVVIDKSLQFGEYYGVTPAVLPVLQEGDNLFGQTPNDIDQYVNNATGEITDQIILGKYGATLVDPATLQN